MATVSEPQVRHTPEELLKIDDRPAPDLVDGQFEERESMSFRSSSIAALVVGILLEFSRPARRGAVTGSDLGFRIFPDDRDKVRHPDAAFIRADKFPPGDTDEGFCTIVPDLVVEVNSPNDSASHLERKIRDYLRAGVDVVWVADPETRTVRVTYADRKAQYLSVEDTLDGGDVLPGFSCPVARFFE